MEYCSGGDLHSFIKKRGPLTEFVVQRFTRQVAQGLKFLRSKNLIHRDLKPQNLLLTEESSQATIKIADFGFARYMAETSLAETMCGSPLYMAPEILEMKKYDYKCDYWSLGAIIFQMLTKRAPFNANNHIKLLHTIKSTRVKIPANLQISNVCRDIILQLLQLDPKKRIDAASFFVHPWILIDNNKTVNNSNNTYYSNTKLTHHKNKNSHIKNHHQLKNNYTGKTSSPLTVNTGNTLHSNNINLLTTDATKYTVVDDVVRDVTLRSEYFDVYV
eukprot:UN29859